MPPLLLHLIPGATRWRRLLLAFYVLSAGAALLKGLEDCEILATGWSDWLDHVPAAMLGLAGLLGLAVQKPVEAHQRNWIRGLLSLMVACAGANLAWPSTAVSLLPDYLVLTFFCVTLYYNERMVFFDFLIKRGAFFAVALVVLTAAFVLSSGFVDRLPADWSRPWLCALLLLPFWLAAPAIYHWLERAIDHICLRRRYSPADAERRFVHAIQIAAGDDDLRRRAAESLQDIFQAPAGVSLSPGTAPAGGLAADLLQGGVPGGWIHVAPRGDSIPFMSDDKRLMQSLARTLSVVMENVRFREREQQLLLLASRAELKALRAQINPHFLFNALNAIAGLIQVQPQLADETVEQLAEVFRYTLRKSEKEWVRLDEEVEFVTAYLRVEQARFGERLETEFSVDPAAAAIPIPAMTIQPLIENAIKHGVAAVAGRGRVSLKAWICDGCLSVEVSDNGPGFAAGAEMGHGLRNIMERLKGYYGESADFQWRREEQRTTVLLKIPCAS
jgi:signal transduction histidine kinase